MRIWLALALVGCSFAEKHYIGDMPRDGASDTPTDLNGDVLNDPRFSCKGQPLPTPPGQIMISGAVQDITAAQSMGNVPVAGIEVVNGTTIFNTSTDAAGNFSRQVQTNMMPVNGRLRVTPPTTIGYLNSNLWPPHPVVMDTIANVPVGPPFAFQQNAGAVHGQRHEHGGRPLHAQDDRRVCRRMDASRRDALITG